MSTLNPYIGFRDSASEAMDFYQTVFGGELTKSTFGQFQASEDPAEANKLKHAQLITPKGYTLMAADTPNSMQRPDVSNISVSLSGPADDGDDLRRYYAGLAEGGTEVMPLEKAPWGDVFGMVVDKFGVSWMVNIVGAD